VNDRDFLVIVIARFLKRYSKAKRTSLFTSTATNVCPVMYVTICDNWWDWP